MEPENDWRPTFEVHGRDHQHRERSITIVERQDDTLRLIHLRELLERAEVAGFSDLAAVDIARTGEFNIRLSAVETTAVERPSPVAEDRDDTPESATENVAETATESVEF
jgi:putative heme degradation protein